MVATADCGSRKAVCQEIVILNTKKSLAYKETFDDL